jgi:hypothetical protein
MLLLQPERRLPAPTTFPSSPAEVLHVISGREPIVTDDPAENPLEWLHQFATPIQRQAHDGRAWPGRKASPQKTTFPANRVSRNRVCSDITTAPSTAARLTETRTQPEFQSWPWPLQGCRWGAAIPVCRLGRLFSRPRRRTGKSGESD